MAYVVQQQPQLSFPQAPVNHSPSPFSFGFGLSSLTPQSLPPHPHHPQQRTQHKRRHDEADEEEAMDRSPTPERRVIRKANVKRMRVVPGSSTAAPDSVKDKSEDDVDVGVLLASLPPQSLLPILRSLLSNHPSLKTPILSLIPRPTLETASNALSQAAKKLKEAYPYSAAASDSYGFGTSTHHARGNTTMRDSYVISRLRPHITEFVSTAVSYLPYFSYLPSPPDAPTKIAAHPTETFAYLSSLTNHVISQPALTQASLAPLILPRLISEWNAWVDRVDTYLNKEAGMFGMEVAKGWERSLDSFADAKIGETSGNLKEVRDKWVSKVGWLVGRRETHLMDDEEL